MRAWGEVPGAGAAATGPPPLAEGWVEILDPEGTPYYHNRELNITQWPRPEAGPLPEGWSEHWDENRSMWYYHCLVDGRVQWKRPAPPPASLAPPPPAAEAPAAAEVPRAAGPPPTPAHAQQHGSPEVPQQASRSPPCEPNPFEPMSEAVDGRDAAGGARGSAAAAPSGSWAGWQGGRAAPLPKQPPARPMARGWEPHVPCLLHEAVSSMLDIRSRCQDGTFDGLYVDCTFGRGGHSRHILRHLSERGRLVAFDVDPEAVAVARRLEREDSRFKIIHRPFADIDKVLRPNTVDGVLIDLGVSSPQLDDRHRGFTERGDEIADMRMNQSQGVSVAEWLRDSQVTAEELAWIIHKWGEDSDALLSERIAALLVEEQRRNPSMLWTTRRLAAAIQRVKKTDPNNMPVAKLAMQALRIWINQEMDQMDMALHGACHVLKEKGRCCVITFKRKEQELLTRFTREHEDPDDFMKDLLSPSRLCELYPLVATNKTFCLRQIDVVKPTLEEVQSNNRSRSSVVHVIRKDARAVMFNLSNLPSRSVEQRLRKPDVCLVVPFKGTDVPDQEVVDYDWVNGLPLQQPQLEARAAAAHGAAPLPERPPAAAAGNPWQPAAAAPERQTAPPERAAPPARGPDPWQEGSDPWAAAGGSLARAQAVSAAKPQQPPPPPSARSPRQPSPARGLGGAPPPAAAHARGPEPGAGALQDDEEGLVALKVMRVIGDFSYDPQATWERAVGGYLSVRRGELVHVFHEGAAGPELGWSYGLVPGEPGSPGWFPSSHVEALTAIPDPVVAG